MTARDGTAQGRNYDTPHATFPPNVAATNGRDTESRLEPEIPDHTEVGNDTREVSNRTTADYRPRNSAYLRGASMAQFVTPKHSDSLGDSAMHGGIVPLDDDARALLAMTPEEMEDDGTTSGSDYCATGVDQGNCGNGGNSGLRSTLGNRIYAEQLDSEVGIVKRSEIDAPAQEAATPPSDHEPVQADLLARDGVGNVGNCGGDVPPVLAIGTGSNANKALAPPPVPTPDWYDSLPDTAKLYWHLYEWRGKYEHTKHQSGRIRVFVLYGPKWDRNTKELLRNASTGDFITGRVRPYDAFIPEESTPILKEFGYGKS